MSPPRQARDNGRARRRLGLVTGGCIVVGLAWALTAAPISSSSGQPRGWAAASLDVVGGPALAGTKALVIDVDGGGQLQLSALDALTGRVLWGTDVSASYIPPAVPLWPVAIGGTTLALVPADGNVKDPEVTVEGLDAADGRVVWRGRPRLIVTDAPVTCDGGAEFCVAGYTPNSSATELDYIDPTNGRVLRSVAGPVRNLGVLPSGAGTKTDLWSTFNTVPTLMQLSGPGSVEWRKTVSSVFGGGQFDPSFGWDFAARANLDVGSVGFASTGGQLQLNEFKTVGISEANGLVEWSLPGFYMCGGALQFLSDDVICNFSGSVTEGRPLHFSKLALTLEGFDAATGKVTWSEQLRDADEVLAGLPQPFLDDQHLAVQGPDGQATLLDTGDGSTGDVAPGEAFWCEQEPSFKVPTAAGASEDGQRTGAPVFSACTADGAASKALPSTQPSSVGADVRGLFIWLSPSGLEAAPAR